MTWNGPTGLGETIFNERYSINEETWEEACRRVSGYVARGNSGEGREEAFHSLLSGGLFSPAGRIWAGGHPDRKGYMLNCYTIGKENIDSREEWGELVKEFIILSSTGGGVGFNVSSIRPNGHPIAGVGGVCTGPVSLLDMVDNSSSVIRAGGGRRTAIWAGLNIDHPDIIEFIETKKNRERLNNMNISVCFHEEMSPDHFFSLVNDNKDIPLRWGHKGNWHYSDKSINAKYLWDLVLECMIENGEPGLMNFDLSSRRSNTGTNYTACNACTECPMDLGLVCCLGSLVLPRFVIDGALDVEALESATRTAVRFLDSVIDTTKFPTDRNKAMSIKHRRIGLGIMGLAHMLAKLKVRYSEGTKQADYVMGLIKRWAYDESANMAKELGKAPEFSWSTFTSGEFHRQLPVDVLTKINENGLRNCNILSVAPTGTTSMVQGTTSGLEPVFAKAYKRRFYRGDTLHHEYVIDPIVTELGSEEFVEDSFDLTAENHIAMLRAVQRHVDQGCSKTINIDQAMPLEELSTTIRENINHLSGITVYPTGSREDAPLEPVTIEEAIKMSCPSGQCDI